MEIFKFSDYRTFLKSWIATLPSKGHGELGRIAKSLRVSPTMISQIVKGTKNLTQEMTADLADYLNLGTEEFEYLVLLVDFDRAGSQNLKSKLKKRIDRIRKANAKIGSRIATNRELTIEQKSVYYSDWIYAAVFNMAAVDGLNDRDGVSRSIGISRDRLDSVIDFLAGTKLLTRTERGFETGKVSIHVDDESPFLRSYLINWRLRALQRIEPQNLANLHLSAAMSMSQEVAAKVRSELLKMIEAINKEVMPSPSEVVRCLNIDWFNS